MPKYETKDIRNIVLVGHNSSGKTTFGDALLFKTKANARMGSVDDGSSIFDFEPEEKDRKNSIDLAAASVHVQGREINILDAPGYPDFVGEAICGMNAAETAVICINAVDGIRVNTRKMWELAQKVGIARFILINKMDLDNIKFLDLITSIRETFGKDCVPVLLPQGSGDAFKGVVSVITNYAGAPNELRDLADESREKLMEADDKMIEEYLEGKPVTTEELVAALPKAFAQGKLVPILCASAKKDLGVAEFLDFVAKFAPSPLDIAPKKGVDPEKKAEVTRQAVRQRPPHLHHGGGGRHRLRLQSRRSEHLRHGLRSERAGAVPEFRVPAVDGVDGGRAEDQAGPGSDVGVHAQDGGFRSDVPLLA